MKVYSIGRETDCNIVINDTSDVISRRHATLNVESNGKMTIVDTSRNGTYVNGIRINSNVPFPVTRKDNVSFAHVARLDWNLVPVQKSSMHYAIIAIVAILLVTGSVVGYNYYQMQNIPEPVVPAITSADSLKMAKDQEMAIKKAVEDSIKHSQDSIKHREDSIRNAKAAAQKAANAGTQGGKSKKDNKDSKTTPSQQDSVKNSRRMGN